jgi:hypothetical protein
MAGDGAGKRADAEDCRRHEQHSSPAEKVRRFSTDDCPNGRAEENSAHHDFFGDGR